MKNLSLMALFIFSHHTVFAKMLNPRFEGRVYAFDQTTVQVNSGYHLITVPRKLINQKQVVADDYVKVRLVDGTLTAVNSQVKISYLLKEK